MEAALRPILPADLEFLWRLHNTALRKYVEKTWGWDEEWQRERFREEFDPGHGEIIVVDGHDAGYWWTIEKPDEIVLASVRLFPEFQNRGIGTRLITDLIESKDKPVRLQVLKINPARGLYERLGFRISSETETHYKMVYHR